MGNLGRLLWLHRVRNVKEQILHALIRPYFFLKILHRAALRDKNTRNKPHDNTPPYKLVMADHHRDELTDAREKRRIKLLNTLRDIKKTLQELPTYVLDRDELIQLPFHELQPLDVDDSDPSGSGVADSGPQFFVPLQKDKLDLLVKAIEVFDEGPEADLHRGLSGWFKACPNDITSTKKDLDSESRRRSCGGILEARARMRWFVGVLDDDETVGIPWGTPYVSLHSSLGYINAHP